MSLAKIKLRREIVWAWLLAGTITENIALGEYPPDMAKIESVCETAGLAGFVKDLPQGYGTVLTADGTNLSGGQRQRIALARAFYFDPQILLLDEPSSSLDAASEAILIDTLETLRDQGRTIVVVAHSRRLVSIADLVVRIESGKAVTAEPGLESSNGRAVSRDC